ncbi:hypothetical protein [Moorena sp. SIO4G3]|uniref:hypothetical protein n=1 Tax=Moorena sp. SIO4G3 TaxID=2607821 RepID=UPI001429E355|nr:hypothetical protein [Moorena sp. SIO4G3]NEO80134.1 hypothetical protein [Moorena sp. SIO4G3]
MLDKTLATIFSTFSISLGLTIALAGDLHAESQFPDGNVPLVAQSLDVFTNQIGFPIELDLTKAQIRGTLPIEKFREDLVNSINQYDGYYIKNTRYNKWKINDINLQSIDNGGATFSFTVNLRKYECIDLFSEKKCTRLFSVTPSGDVSLGIAIRNNDLQVAYRKHNVRGRGWYSDALTLLESLFRNQTVKVIKKGLANFDGVNLISYLKDAGFDKQLKPYGITLDKLVKAGVSINADVTPKGLNFVIDLPKTITLE